MHSPTIIARISVKPDEAYQPVEHQSEEEHTHDEMLQSGEGFEGHRGQADKQPQAAFPRPLVHRRYSVTGVRGTLPRFASSSSFRTCSAAVLSSTRKSGIAFNARSRSSLDASRRRRGSLFWLALTACSLRDNPQSRPSGLAQPKCVAHCI